MSARRRNEMSAGTLKSVGIACLALGAVLLVVCLFVVFKRGHDNATKAEAGNEMMQSSSPSGMSAVIASDDEPGPGLPLVTLFSLVFAVIASVGGVVCLVLASKRGKKSKKVKLTASSSRFLDSLKGGP